MRVRWLGEAALMVDVNADQVAALASLLRGQPGVEDAVAGEDSVVILGDPLTPDLEELASLLATTPPAQGPALGQELGVVTSPGLTAREAPANLGARGQGSGPSERPAPPVGPPLVIPVRYDGADLAEVAALCGLSVEEVAERHQQPTYQVAHLGFVPGFAYLRGLDPALEVPRRPRPRTAVPAGSVAVAGPRCCVYPRATPGGWRLLGTTALPLWDLGRDPPALLEAGQLVRFASMA